MSSMMDQARTRVPRMAEAAVERARLSVVPRRGLRRAGRVPFVALVCLVLVAGVAGLLYLNTTMQQVSIRTTALEQRAQDLDAQRQGLQSELDGLDASQQLALRAKALGMVPQAGPVFISLGTGKVQGTPTPASRAYSWRVGPEPTKAPPRRKKIVTDEAGPGAAGADHGVGTGTKKARRALH